MQKKILILIAGVLLACTAMSYYFKKKTKPAAIYESRITVTGSAKNISGQAAVVAPSTDIYYVDGLEEWEQDWLNQEVKVTGDLVNRDSRIVKQNKTAALRDSSENIIKAAVVLLLQKESGYDY